MRHFCILGLITLVLSTWCGPAAHAELRGSGAAHIEWEVKNRFRLFRSDADFQRHVAATRSDGRAGGRAAAGARDRWPRLGPRYGGAHCASTAPASCWKSASGTACARSTCRRAITASASCLPERCPRMKGASGASTTAMGPRDKSSAPPLHRGSEGPPPLRAPQHRERRYHFARWHRAAAGERDPGARSPHCRHGRFDRGRRGQPRPAGAALRQRLLLQALFREAANIIGPDGRASAATSRAIPRDRAMMPASATGRGRARAGMSGPATARSTAIRCALHSRSRSTTRTSRSRFIPLGLFGRDHRSRAFSRASAPRECGPEDRRSLFGTRSRAQIQRVTDRAGDRARYARRSRPRPGIAHHRGQRHSLFRTDRQRHYRAGHRAQPCSTMAASLRSVPGRAKVLDRELLADFAKLRAGAQAAGRRKSVARRAMSVLRQSRRWPAPTRPARAGVTASTCIRPSPPTLNVLAATAELRVGQISARG